MKGKVWLIGAGPGDPSLITVKGLHCIRHADALVYDRLVCKELLAEVPMDCEMINVGKTPNNHPIPQAGHNTGAHKKFTPFKYTSAYKTRPTARKPQRRPFISQKAERVTHTQFSSHQIRFSSSVK